VTNFTLLSRPHSVKWRCAFRTDSPGIAAIAAILLQEIIYTLCYVPVIQACQSILNK